MRNQNTLRFAVEGAGRMRQGKIQPVLPKALPVSFAPGARRVLEAGVAHVPMKRRCTLVLVVDS